MLPVRPQSENRTELLRMQNACALFFAKVSKFLVREANPVNFYTYFWSLNRWEENEQLYNGWHRQFCKNCLCCAATSPLLCRDVIRKGCFKNNFAEDFAQWHTTCLQKGARCCATLMFVPNVSATRDINLATSGRGFVPHDVKDYLTRSIGLERAYNWNTWYHSNSTLQHLCSRRFGETRLRVLHLQSETIVSEKILEKVKCFSFQALTPLEKRRSNTWLDRYG